MYHYLTDFTIKARVLLALKIEYYEIVKIDKYKIGKIKQANIE